MQKLFSFLKQEITSRLPKLLEDGVEIQVPLCPDYIIGGIADGVSPLMMAALDAAKEVQAKYRATTFVFLIADTEEDILQGFDRKPIQASCGKFASRMEEEGVPGKSVLFSEIFSDWHSRQYQMEEEIRKVLVTDTQLEYFLTLHECKRAERYSSQYGYGKKLKGEEVRALQVRHYAQYLLLREIMHERGQLVLMNYQTENLRAVTKHHSFLPERRRLELIVY